MSSAPRAIAPTSDAPLLVGLGGLIGGCTVVWLAASVGGLLERGAWPRVGMSDAARAIPQLVRHPGDIGAAFRPALRAGLPGPMLFYGVLITVGFLCFGALVAVVQWRSRTRSSPGWATRTQIQRHLSARAVQGKASLIRPSITEQRPDPCTVGIHLGRDQRTRIEVYGSLEDSYVIVGPPRSGKGIHLVIPALLDAPGAAVVPSTKPDTLAATASSRALSGPVHVFDPQGLAQWPTRLRWAPERGCTDPLTAIMRARALTAGARTNVGLENGDFWTGMTQAVVRCYLHAAALDARPIRHVLRWAANPADPEPIRILRTSKTAAEGWAEELDEQAAADQRQRGSVWAGVRRAFDSLADPRVLDACSPGPEEAFDAGTFLRERGTLYLLGSSGAQLSIAPLVTALIEEVVEAGRRLAAHAPGGRLDPPLMLLLDEVANIAPLPSLPSLLADGGGVGIPTVAVLQSLAQARGRWGEAGADAIWDTATSKIVLGGLAQARDLADIAGLAGEHDEQTYSRSSGRGGASSTTATRRAPVLAADRLRNLDFGTAVLLQRALPPVQLQMRRTDGAKSKGFRRLESLRRIPGRPRR